MASASHQPRSRRGPAVVAAHCGIVLAGIASATPVNLGSAGNYAVLGIGGSVAVQSDFEVYQSGTVINGNVGVGPYTTWTHGVDCTINGRIDNHVTNAPPIVTGTVTGGVHQVDMTGAVLAARAASSFAASLGATQTFSTLSSGQTIVGGGGLNVIRLTGDIGLSGGSTTLHLQGSASSSFIFQIVAADAPSAHTLTLSGVHIDLLGGLTPDNVVWNMNGTGGGIVISSGAVVPGIFLAPDRGILVDHGTVTGAVIGGGGADSHSNSVSVHSGSEIDMLTTIPLPQALPLALAGVAMAASLRRRTGRSERA